jgi:hypothetical protein
MDEDTRATGLAAQPATVACYRAAFVGRRVMTEGSPARDPGSWVPPLFGDVLGDCR